MNEQGESTNGGHLIRDDQLCLSFCEIMMIINSSHDVDEIFREVVKEMCQGLGCESARIAMREGDHWVIRYVNNLPDDLIGRSFTDEELPHAALAMTTRKPVAIDDASHDDRTTAEMMASQGIKSVLALPLVENNVVTGTLLFEYHSRAVPFAEVVINFAERMATGVAIALQNARVYSELEESKRLSDALNEIDAVLFSTKDYDAVMIKMLQLATDVIGADTAVIFSKEGDRWRTRYVYKLSESLVGQSFSNTEVMHTAITAETKRSIVIQDVSNNPDIDQKFVKMLGVRSLLDFPLIVKGEVIGDLTFHYHSSAVPFNESQVEFARKLQISISLALETGRLFNVSQDAIAGRKQAEEMSAELSREIAQRTLTEAALRAAQTESERYVAEIAAFLDAVPAAVFIAHDVECSQMSGNRVTQDLLGLPTTANFSVCAPSYEQSTNFLYMKDGRKIPADQLPVQRAARGQEVRNYEFDLVFADGRVRTLLGDAVSLLDKSDRPRGAIGAFIDITERKQAEKALRESEQRYRQLNETLEKSIKEAVDTLRDKDRMLIIQSRQAIMGEMINNIAHQWRQPLNMLGLLAQELPVIYKQGKFSTEYIDVNVKKTMAIIQQMSKTIDDFRDFSGSDKEKVNFKVVKVIEKTMSMLEGSIAARGIRCEIKATGDPSINGYPNEFAQVLLNIVNNARDAFLDRKTVSPTITIRLRTEAGKTIVTISDNAGGIPEGIIDKIFEPYFTTKGPDKGTGIGLYMSKTIIEKSMNGTLTVCNVGDGAEFRIEI